MTARLLAGLVPALFVSTAFGQTVFVDDDFESYGSQSAFDAVWAPVDGTGLSSVGAGGALVDQASGVDGQTGNAISGPAGVVNEHVDGFSLANTSGFLLQPSATESIVVRGDMYIGADNGATIRQTIGLRGDIFTRDAPGSGLLGTNFIEMGTWNGDVCAPTVADDLCDPGDPGADPPVEGDPAFRPETDFAFRVQLFDFTTLGNYFENGEDIGPMVRQPNWQYFPLKEELDTVVGLPNGNDGNGDGQADLTDIGSGWHTFEATISDESVTLTLDLFRDGIDNSTGLAGVDSEVIVEVAMAENFDADPFKFDPSPMNSLRIGSPSGVSSDPGVASFDNLYLALEEAVDETLIGDYNGDLVVDAADYTIWADSLGDSVAAGTGADGNGNGVIDGPLSGPGNDYEIWANNYGATAAAAAAIPEPTAALLAALAGIGIGACRR